MCKCGRVCAKGKHVGSAEYVLNCFAEASVNLNGFFKKAHKDQQSPSHSIDRQFIVLTHPNYEGPQVCSCVREISATFPDQTRSPTGEDSARIIGTSRNFSPVF